MDLWCYASADSRGREHMVLGPAFLGCWCVWGATPVVRADNKVLTIFGLVARPGCPRLTDYCWASFLVASSPNTTSSSAATPNHGNVLLTIFNWIVLCSYTTNSGSRKTVRCANRVKHALKQNRQKGNCRNTTIEENEQINQKAYACPSITTTTFLVSVQNAAYSHLSAPNKLSLSLSLSLFTFYF